MHQVAWHTAIILLQKCFFRPFWIIPGGQITDESSRYHQSLQLVSPESKTGGYKWSKKQNGEMSAVAPALQATSVTFRM